MGARWKHFKTISKHKWYVFQECQKCGLFWRGLIHDLSKFSPTEFSASAKYFQGDRSPIEAEKEAIGYSAAWQHHKGHNPHHWEYWIDFDTDGNIIANKIPINYVIEMVCDWIGAGKAYTKNSWTKEEPWNYYCKVSSGRHFHPDTKYLIEFLLLIIKDKGLEEFHKVSKCMLKTINNYYDYSKDISNE